MGEVLGEGQMELPGEWVNGYFKLRHQPAVEEIDLASEGAACQPETAQLDQCLIEIAEHSGRLAIALF